MGHRDFSGPLLPLKQCTPSTPPPGPGKCHLLHITPGIPGEGGVALCEGDQGIGEADYGIHDDWHSGGWVLSAQLGPHRCCGIHDFPLPLTLPSPLPSAYPVPIGHSVRTKLSY